MTKNSISRQHRQTFEGIKNQDDTGYSGHAVEDHIEDILDMVEIGSGAKCEIQPGSQSGYAVDDHFVDVNKMVKIGFSAYRQPGRMSRFFAHST